MWGGGGYVVRNIRQGNCKGRMTHPIGLEALLSISQRFLTALHIKQRVVIYNCVTYKPRVVPLPPDIYIYPVPMHILYADQNVFVLYSFLLSILLWFIREGLVMIGQSTFKPNNNIV